MSKEAKKEVVVCDGKDKDSTTDTYRISSVYQGGQVDGHFLKFVRKDDGLITTAKRSDNSKIKLETFQGDDGNDDHDQLCVIIDPNNTDRALKLVNKDDGTSSFIVEQNLGLPDAIKSYNKVTTDMEFQPFLFKKIPQKGGKSPFYLCSYKPDNKKSFFLAVDDKGHLRMDSPPELPVDGNHDSKCLFRMREAN